MALDVGDIRKGDVRPSHTNLIFLATFHYLRNLELLESQIAWIIGAIRIRRKNELDFPILIHALKWTFIIQVQCVGNVVTVPWQ